MKKLLILSLILFSCILAGSSWLTAGGADVTIVTPNGTTFGYVYPDGSFRLDGPGSIQSQGQMPTTEPMLAPPSSTFGYKHGDTTIIVGPNGPAFMYDHRGK